MYEECDVYAEPFQSRGSIFCSLMAEIILTNQIYILQIF